MPGTSREYHPRKFAHLRHVCSYRGVLAMAMRSSHSYRSLVSGTCRTAIEAGTREPSTSAHAMTVRRRRPCVAPVQWPSVRTIFPKTTQGWHARPEYICSRRDDPQETAMYSSHARTIYRARPPHEHQLSWHIGIDYGCSFAGKTHGDGAVWLSQTPDDHLYLSSIS